MWMQVRNKVIQQLALQFSDNPCSIIDTWKTQAKTPTPNSTKVIAFKIVITHASQKRGKATYLEGDAQFVISDYYEE